MRVMAAPVRRSSSCRASTADAESISKGTGLRAALWIWLESNEERHFVSSGESMGRPMEPHLGMMALKRERRTLMRGLPRWQWRMISDPMCSPSRSQSVQMRSRS